jgi:hypothetical protein
VGTLVRVGGSSDDWWRETLPWPPGVQEDDEVHWNFASPDERADHEDGAAMRVEPAPLAVRLQAVRPGLRGRQPGR